MEHWYRDKYIEISAKLLDAEYEVRELRKVLNSNWNKFEDRHPETTGEYLCSDGDEFEILQYRKNKHTDKMEWVSRRWGIDVHGAKYWREIPKIT
jgi:hypothetical protein